MLRCSSKGGDIAQENVLRCSYWGEDTAQILEIRLNKIGRWAGGLVMGGWWLVGGCQDAKSCQFVAPSCKIEVT